MNIFEISIQTAKQDCTAKKNLAKQVMSQAVKYA